MQFLIPDNLRKTAGIYIIRAKGIHHVYVGSSRDLSNRFGNHVSMLNTGNHHNTRLQAFVNEYGINSLSFDLLESVAIGEDLAVVEQRWINELQSYKPEKGFNASLTVGQSNIVKESDPLISVRAQKALIERGKQIATKRGMNLSVMMRMLLIDEVTRIEALEKASASK